MRASETARVVEILDGRELFIDARQAEINQTALSPQQLNTRNSRAHLTFRSGATARLNRFTQLRLGRSCFLLTKGQVLVSGKQSGCTKSLRLSSRGTTFIISVNADGSTDVMVLEGVVEAEHLQNAAPFEQPSNNLSVLLSELLLEINQRRLQLGKAAFPSVPAAVQAAIEPYGLLLINAMKRTGGCFHGGSNGVASPFDFVKLPRGWSVVGEVLGCPAVPGVWDPAIVARMLQESPSHKRIVYDSRKATAIGCVWSTAQSKHDTEAMVCLTVRHEGQAAVAAAPLIINAGRRFRFSDTGSFLSSAELGAGDYTTILGGPFFLGFVSTLLEQDALDRQLRDQLRTATPAGSPADQKK
ncbi:FecR family protein [Synechococcus sp. CS-1324]|uniref:FecR family protein n=1 Tax=Synechococcus sp. CS-1324 TaxID=2847980 RepID=UPI00223B542A|nr:FecR family protein [Synechococcus sp. CS-1324]MCT0230329.1 FecR family protein [Synechococcus sp. CS-1324]